MIGLGIGLLGSTWSWRRCEAYLKNMFQDYLARWQLIPNGEPITTATSHLLPVISDNRPAMLKITRAPEEKLGGAVMSWWSGGGAAEVLAWDGDALLLERATGSRSLAEMAQNGSDEDACQIICEVIARLHAPRDNPAPPVTPLADWFQELTPAAAKHGGIWTLCADTAKELLAHPQGNQLLHGDIHHGNILDFGKRGWLVIDPKGLWGERGFDYANLFCNPDPKTATGPGRVARRADIVADAAGLDRHRLLMWVLAWSGLSAAWMLSDREAPDHALTVAAQAAAELGMRV